MIFVTGGTGLVGCNLLLQLAEKGKKIKALKRPNSNIKNVEKFFKLNKAQEIFHFIEWVEGDLLDIPFIESALKNIKTIYHTAAFVSFDEKDSEKILENNILGTEIIINQAIESNVDEFIYVSSIATLDDANLATKLIDEESTWNTEIHHSTYAISKYRAEMEVWRGSQEGLNVIIVNPSVIIGAFDGNRESERILKNNFINKFAPTGGTGFVDVRDVVNVILLLQERNIYNQKFIISSENRTYNSILKEVQKNYSRKKIVKLPNFILKIFQYLSSFCGLFNFAFFSNSIYKSLTTITKYDNKKVKNTLNYKFVPINDAIAYHLKNLKKINTTK